MKIALIILECLVSVALIGAVMFQSGNEGGLGALAGNSETYMGKNKAATLEKKLAFATKILAVVWLIMALVLNFV